MLKICTSIFCFWLLNFNIKKRRLISASTVWIACYLIIFVVFPIVSSNVYEMENIIDIYALVGITCYGFGTIIAERVLIRKYDKETTTFLYPDFSIAKYMFWISFALFILAITRKIGSEGIRSILNGEITSKQMTLGDKYSKSFMFIYALHLMIPFLLAIWINGKDKRMKYISISVFAICTLLFGFTRLFLMCTLAIIVFHEMRNLPEKKKAYWLSVVLIAGIILMTFMNFVRTWGVDDLSDFSNKLSLDYVLESTDFGASYKWFNELLKKGSPHIFPLSYLKAFYSFIPRSIWENKPAPLSLQILQYVNPALAESGYSTAGNSVLGEAYAVMDIIGIVIYPIIWGWLTTFLDRHYYHRLSKHEDGCLRNIYYYIFMTFIVISAQRGDWSQYTVIILWLYYVPLYIASKIKTKEDIYK